MKFATQLIHAGIEPDPATGAVMTPIYQTSTYAQLAPGVHKGFEYSRTHNPTRHVLEKNLAALEMGTHALCFASGMASIDCVIHLLNPGDEVICADDVYGGTFRIFKRVYEKMGIKTHFVDMSNPKSMESYFTAKTRLVWIETPTNPLLKIIDIQAIADIARKHKVKVAVDNTFSTPFLQKPLQLGADIVVHSATKYLSGHSDVVLGALIVKDQTLYDDLAFYQNSCGGVPGPMDCFLVLRGLKTLHLRMERHCLNAKAVVSFLSQHPRVSSVHYPGLQTHVGYAVAQKQMLDFGGMLSFTLKNTSLEETIRVLSAFQLFTVAESLGGVESLVGHPASMTHASIPKDIREPKGITDHLIRLSVGIEDKDDLIADLEQALKA